MATHVRSVSPRPAQLWWRLESETSLEPSRVILISTYAEEDLADLISATPAAGFLCKSDLSARAIREILGNTGGGLDSRTS
jgi:hypothetical protein